MVTGSRAAALYNFAPAALTEREKNSLTIALVKTFQLLALFLTFALLTGCTTLANRRDLYFPQTVEGPYTRMLRDGIPQPDAQAYPMSGASDFKNVR